MKKYFKIKRKLFFWDTDYIKFEEIDMPILNFVIMNSTIGNPENLIRILPDIPLLT